MASVQGYEMKRFKYLLKNILAILAVTVALFGCAMRNGSCSPNDFLGPKPGMAIVYENSLNPGVPSRVVGMDIDADGVLRIMHEIGRAHV